MKNILRDSLKTALIFGLIGIIASVAVPPLAGMVATALGVATTGIPAIGMGHTATVALTFGLFGFLEPIIKPVFNFAFGKSEPVKTGEAQGKEPGRHKSIVIQISPRAEQPQPHLQARSQIQQVESVERMVASQALDIAAQR